MTSSLVGELGALTGTELFYLASDLADAMSLAAAAAVVATTRGQDPAPWTEWYSELQELFSDVAMQAARIDVPLTQAQAILARYMFSRGRPLRVAGT